MIEIGNLLPNLTEPTSTISAAEAAALNGLVLFVRDHAGRLRPDQPNFVRISGLRQRLLPAAQSADRPVAVRPSRFADTGPLLLPDR